MTVTIANTNLVDSFNTWRLNTNLAATTIGNNVVTVTRTGAARGGTSRGDGHIKGTFSALNFRSSAIRGGNTTNESAITLHSNTTINARTFTVSANAEFTGNVNFTTAADDRIILGDISRIRVTGGNSGDFLRKTNASEITATPLTMRNLGDLSSNSGHIILSSSNTSFSEENNTPDLRFSAGPSGQDKFRVYGDGDSTAGNSDLLIQLVSADADSTLKIQTNANNTVHTFGADGTTNHTGRITSVGLTTSGTILPSGGSVNIGSGSAKFLDGNFAGTVSTDKLNLSTTAGDGVSSNLLPDTHNAKDLGNSDYQWRNIFSSGTSTLNNVTIGGTLGTTGDLTAVNLITTGNVDLGNATSDTITATGQFDSDLIPSTDNARDLGSSSKEWKDLHLTGVGYIDELSIATGSGQGVSSHLIPKTDGTHNLGSANREWQNLYIDGTAKIDTLTVDDNATFAGSITATNGTTTLSTGAISTANITTLNVTGLSSLDGGIDVDGAFTVADSSGNMVTTGTATVGGLASLNGGIAVDTNKFTVADTSGNVDTAGTLTVAGATTLNGDVTLGNHSSDTITMNGTIAGNPSYTSLAVSNNMDIGDNASDTLTITASVDSNIVPTGSVNLGSTGNRWASIYATDIVANNITLGTSGQGAGNSLTVYGNLTVTGTSTAPGGTVSAPSGTYNNLSATGVFNSTGETNLGDGPSDTISMIGSVDTNIIPSGTRELGSSSAPWEKLHVNDIDIKDDLAVVGLMTVGETLAVTSSISGGSLAISGASNFAGNVDFDGAITRDGGTVLFDTNGVLNASGSIAAGAITSTMLADANTDHSASQTIGSASAVPVITFNKKGQITKASTATVAGVTGFAVGNGASGKTFTITTADGSTFAATVGAGSITSTQLDTISGLTETTYGSATQVPVIEVNDKGRVIAASQVAVAGISSVGYTSANNNVRISTGDGKTHDLVVAPATASVRGVASFDSGDFAVSSGAVSLKNATTGAVLAIAGTANETDVSRSNGTVTVGLPQDVTISRDLDVTRNVSITGNLTVAGTTTTVNSTTVSIKDPIFELGEDSSDDNLDRGIIMKYNNSGAKKAFMGYDDSANKFLMIPDATDTSSVISGTAGTLVANIEGNVAGNVTGNIDGIVGGNTPAAGSFTTIGTTGNITISGGSSKLVGNVQGNVTGNISSSGSSTLATVDINGGAIDGTTIGGSSAAAGSFTTINASGTITGDVTGDLTGNAATATKLAASKTIGGTAFDGSANIDVKVKVGSDETSNANKFLTFVDSTTSTFEQDLKEASTLTYNPFTDTLTAPKISAGTEFIGNTMKNTSGHNVITILTGEDGADAGEMEFHGVASKANVWASPRSITIDGAVKTQAAITGIDGSGNIEIDNVVFASGGTQAATADINDDAITEIKILDGAVTADKLKSSSGTDSDRAVTKDHIRDEAVIRRTIDDDAIDGPKIDGTATNFEVTQWKVDNLNFDGNSITTSGTGTQLTLDADGDINLDSNSGVIAFKDNGTQIGRIRNVSSGNYTFQADVQDKDIVFNGNDGGSVITALTLSMSNAGAATFNNDVTAFSDARLKENVSTIENALDKVDNLRGVNYTHKATGDEKIGVIAQEVEEILPQVVLTADDEMQTKSVDYGKLCAVLIEAVKELKKEVEELKGK